MISFTRDSEIVRGRPGRGASFCSAASPPFRKRSRQRATSLGWMPNSAAIALSCHPSAARSTMRARSTTRAGNHRARLLLQGLSLLGVECDGWRNANDSVPLL
jgi:hypothetical protein